MKKENNLSKAELSLLQAVFDHFNETGEWPNSNELNVELRKMGDLWENAKAIGFDYIDAQQHGEPCQTSLTVLGISLCKGSKRILGIFLNAMKLCASKYINNSRDPKVTGTDLFTELKIEHEDLKRLMNILKSERRFSYSFKNENDLYGFEITLSKDILRFEEITSISDYIKTAYTWLNQESSRSISHDEVFYFDNLSFNIRIFQYLPELVSSDKLKNVIVQDSNELLSTIQSSSWKCVCILCGSISEAILFDHLLQIIPDEIQDMQKREKATLRNLIDKAVQQGLVQKYVRGMLDAVREMRNLIHPAMLDDMGAVSPKMAEASFKLLEAIAEAISLRKDKNFPNI